MGQAGPEVTRRSLVASVNGETVGELQEVNGLWAFQYSPGWLASPTRYALSPKLPLQAQPLVDGASLRPVQWYFDNLLPEEGQRTLLATQAQQDAADAFGLLAYYGAESAGSLTLLAAGSDAQMPTGLRPLSEADLSERIRRMPKVPLTQDATKRMSLAGAQHKLAVVLDQGVLYEPLGHMPSTHILKPDHPDGDYPHSVVNEWFVMRLARKLGLEVPLVHRRYVPEPVYLIDRFDRVLQAGAWHRRHAIDACQLLGLDRSFKYAQGSMQSLAALADACRSPAMARTRLFNWLVFNALTGNSDAHLKNLSFTVSDQGVQLAPHYDLLSVACYESVAYDKQGWPQRTNLAWPILGASRFADLNKERMLDAGVSLHLARSTAARLHQQMCQKITAAAQDLYTEVEGENTLILKNRPELGATFGGELRCLRAIVYTVIQPMVERLL